jgi:iron complex transport system permease protein
MNAPSISATGRLRLGLLALLGLSALLLLLSLGAGSTGWATLLQMPHDALSWHIVTDIRLPRAVGAWLAGALLGLAGALAQGLFRNPLADPFLLGSASGASFGVVLMLVWLHGVAWVSLSDHWLLRLGLTGAAFVGAMLAVVLTLALARGVMQRLQLLLAGVVVGVVLGALSQLLMLLQPAVLLSMQAFLLGSTGFLGWSACALMLGVWLCCLSLAWYVSPVLDALSLGETTAASLGLNLQRWRLVLVGVLALATAAAVAQTGLIAFVGLAAPHLARALWAAPHRYAVFLASLVGALLLLVADTLARTLMAPQELPVGLLTAVIGGVYLLWLMPRLVRFESQP